MTAVERVKKEYEKKLKEAEIEDQLSSLCLDSAKIHVLSRKGLYKTVAWITYGDDLGYTKPAATWEDAKAAVRKHPPMGAILVRDGSTSIRPSSSTTGDEASVQTLAPIWLELDTQYTTRLRIHWYSETPAGIVRIGLEMGMLSSHPHIASHGFAYAVVHGERVVVDQHLSIGPELHSIRTSDGRPVAQVESPIKWASGGPSYPSRYSIIFCHLDAEPNDAKVGEAMISFMASLSERKVQ